MAQRGGLMARCAPAAGMAIALVAGGLWSGTFRHDPSPLFLARWGYDLDALREGRVYTLITMALFPTTRGDWPTMFAQATLFVLLIGLIAGPGWAVWSFWGPNIIGTALVSSCIIWPLDAAGVGFAHSWATEADSGASVGIYGALGLLLALLPRRVRWIAVLGMTLWLILAIVREHHVWNIEHLSGYLLGVRSAWWAVRGRQQADWLR